MRRRTFLAAAAAVLAAPPDLAMAAPYLDQERGRVEYLQGLLDALKKVDTSCWPFRVVH